MILEPRVHAQKSYAAVDEGELQNQNTNRLSVELNLIENRIEGSHEFNICHGSHYESIGFR